MAKLADAQKSFDQFKARVSGVVLTCSHPRQAVRLIPRSGAQAAVRQDDLPAAKRLLTTLKVRLELLKPLQLLCALCQQH
jgi:hypothetical protein